ncbi:MAG: two-component regulator propeller domain-containing protein [Gemmatimonadales bacterium]|nr:two-component regulator propeller domain-containing protein [Gemmatimonadales bacterium]
MTRTLLLATTLVIASAPPPASAQVTFPTFGRYQLDVWRAQDGVRLAYTSNLVQTRDGYLWLSSESGVTRFDGVRFRVFDGTNTPLLQGRPRLQTVPLLEDGDGVLWVGTDIGLLGYANGVMRAAAVNETFKTDQVNAAIAGPKGTVWAVTRSGRVFSIPRGGKLTPVTGTILSYAGSSLSVDPTGDVWIAAGQDAVYRVHRDTLSRVTFPPGVLVDSPNRAYATADSSVWFGTPTAILQWKHGRLRRFELPPHKNLGAVSSIAAGPDGRLWIGTHGAGLYQFDGRQFIPFTTRDGLSDDRVIDILPDKSGNIWVATRDGLNRFRPVPFDVFTSRTGLPTGLPGGMVQDPSGTFWLAPPTGGLFRGRIEPGRVSFAQAEAVRNYDRVTALGRGLEGSVWAGRLLGSVSRFRGSGPPHRPVADGLPPVTEIHEDSDGTLWIGTWRGLFRLANGRRDSLTIREGLPDDFIHRIYRDSKGTLWIATQTGIARATGDDERRFAIQPMPQGSALRAVVLFEAPKGTLWLGSAEGLARVTGGIPAHLTTAQGLPENWIGAGEEDGASHLWLGQLGGLTRVRFADLIAVADGRAQSLGTVTTYSVLDGLPGGDPGAWPHPWSLRDADGKLWFAMGHGIVSVDPAEVKPGVRLPAMHLEEILVDGAAVPTAPSITLGPSVRRLELRYTGVDLSSGPDVRFRYRLDPFDTTWTDVGTQRTASFTRLPAGDYRFRVVGRAPNGGWSPEEVAVNLQVLAPLYRRAWFLTLVGSIVAVTLWSLHRATLRTRSAAIHEERSRLAREIHDSLLQGFGGIALELHAASARLALPPDQQPLLDRVLLLIDRTLTQARDVVWDIRQPGAADEELTTACEASAERTFAGCSTVVRVARRGELRPLSRSVQTECLRIVDEALMNVRKHAEATTVQVDLDYRPRELVLTVRDDGRGFDPEAVARRPGHWGLLGIRERAERIGASLVLTSRPGEGTRFSLVVPNQRESRNPV